MIDVEEREGERGGERRERGGERRRGERRREGSDLDRHEAIDGVSRACSAEAERG